MATGHQVERVVGERERRLLGVGDNDSSERMEQRGRPGDVGRPTLCGDQRRWEVLGAGGKVFTMLDTAYVYMDVFLPTAGVHAWRFASRDVKGRFGEYGFV